MAEIQPNIVFTILVAAWFTKNLSYTYIKAVKTILYYLKKSINSGIIYSSKKKLFFKWYLDLNWVSKKKSQKLMLDFIFILNRNQVSWCFKKQPTIVFSSTKIKNIILILIVKKTILFCFFLTKFDLL